MSERASRRSGRRPGSSGTQEAILASARELFGAHGYDRPSVRAIAATAGVDPALVTHYFGSKQQLFVAAMRLPIDFANVMPELLRDPHVAGRRLAEFMIAQLESESQRRQITGLVRAAASEPQAAAMVRALVSGEMLSAIGAQLGTEDAPLRASLIGSQMVGLVMARHVVGVEPLASLEPEALAEVLAPTLQRYLTGDLR
ncbi:MAG: Transcriptional regulator, AcrR family [uncultured Solirubrobacteraceae bacterium]|uniref:Transcriptional regulator, AcrR family n=1 Tax=uncultured Solirubrobacteraceae bacterium TaxID=1162706 RepID=A0A6J4S456_9ACTN|nr:MAG: Transcriptional regulator, AcrR family [uncultured Solirubrobacteraceae bacterium]